MNAYKFAHHENVPTSPPKTPITELLDKAFSDTPLTREEKDRIAEILYGTCGSGGASYKLSGWQWFMPPARQIKRILVSFNYERGTFRTYYAPDKTSLKKVLSNVSEMVYLE